MSSDKLLALCALVLLAGCPLSNGTGSDCKNDGECSGGDVCARDGVCTVSSQVREATAMWTINGAPASVMSCGSHPDLYLSFIGDDSSDTLGFSPVPCRIGQFLVDKLPTRFRQVELGVEGGSRDIKPINGSGIATLDLRL
jgi:hypothetical protein